MVDILFGSTVDNAVCNPDNCNCDNECDCQTQCDNCDTKVDSCDTNSDY